MTINRFCSSGLQSIALAAGSIAAGYHDIVVAGGVESMTAVPMTGFHLSASPELMDKMPTAHTPMGITAENVANRFGITRQQQDEFAYGSQMKARAAIEQGRFKDEIVPVRAVRYDKGERVYRDFVVDEMPRGDTTLEGLAKLPPVFAQGGSVTAGNSSPISDGAAMTIVTTREKADALGIRPLGIFKGFAAVGVDPEIMGIGPVPAVRKLLGKHGLAVSDIDLFELNEAFACQAVYCQRELGIPDDRLNVNGGAIALGHPLGCTGAKLTATALYELRRRGGRYAVVSMCIGGGQGAAGLFEAIR
jgi:acetyl-CoA acyltransferase